jgi:DNA mismatch repair protein MutH
MNLLSPTKILNNEEELLKHCQLIEGLSFLQLAASLQLAIPPTAEKRKGWTGSAIELALGTTAGNKAIPDFEHLGIELKTLPLNANFRPAESTFVTSISLLTVHQESWLTSQCYKKLRRILWVPIEGSRNIPFEHRRIGKCFLWSPNPNEMTILSEDWNELVLLIITGRLDEINARMGQYLQIRPKAANAKSLCYGFDIAGRKILTLPRGFYLRSNFTEQILKTAML